MDLTTLAARCRDETQKYRAGIPSDPSFCLQLWRSALQGATEAECSMAWEWVYAQYSPQVASWFASHPLAPLVEQYGTKDDFVQIVFLRIVKRNKRAPLRLDSLDEVITFVHRCLIREILKVARRRRPLSVSLNELESKVGSEDPEDEAIRREQALEVWRRLCACAVETADPAKPGSASRQVRLITLRWAQEYMPSEIVKSFPETCADMDAHEISLVLAKIKACYKRKYGADG